MRGRQRAAGEPRRADGRRGAAIAGVRAGLAGEPVVRRGRRAPVPARPRGGRRGARPGPARRRRRPARRPADRGCQGRCPRRGGLRQRPRRRRTGGASRDRLRRRPGLGRRGMHGVLERTPRAAGTRLHRARRPARRSGVAGDPLRLGVLDALADPPAPRVRPRDLVGPGAGHHHRRLRRPRRRPHRHPRARAGPGGRPRRRPPALLVAARPRGRHRGGAAAGRWLAPRRLARRLPLRCGSGRVGDLGGVDGRRGRPSRRRPRRARRHPGSAGVAAAAAPGHRPGDRPRLGRRAQPGGRPRARGWGLLRGVLREDPDDAREPPRQRSRAPQPARRLGWRGRHPRPVRRLPALGGRRSRSRHHGPDRRPGARSTTATPPTSTPCSTSRARPTGRSSC